MPAAWEAAAVAVAGAGMNLMQANADTTTSTGPLNSKKTSESAKTTFTLDPTEVDAIEALITGGEFSKDTAIQNSQSAQLGVIQKTLQERLPVIGANAKTSGIASDSMTQILAQDSLIAGGVAAAEVQRQAIDDNNDALVAALNSLTVGSPQVQEEKSSSVLKQAGTSSTQEKSTCFITTAVCEVLGYEDDCAELTALRVFRDTYMRSTHELAMMVQEYYQTAPAIVDKLNSIPSEWKEQMCNYVMHSFIKPAVLLINKGEDEKALVIYKSMISFIKTRLDTMHINKGVQ
jgi:hypothetical protein